MEDKDTSKETTSVTGNQDTIEGTASSGGDTRKSLRRASHKVKAMLILLSVFAYVTSFMLMHYTWDYGMGVVAIIPVVVVAWLYGCAPGIVAALLTFFANILMREFVGQYWMTRMIQQGIAIPGTVAFMFIGGIIGRLSDVRIQLREELSKREEIEKESKEARNFLENIFNTSADGIMVTDSKGCIVRVNKAIEQMLGFREDELIGNYTSELGGQNEERIRIRKLMLSQLFEKGYVNNWETVWRRKDESLCPVGINITFLKDRKGNISGSVAAVRDITERKKYEEELKKARDHLNNIIESSLDGIIVSDSRGYITRVNNSFLKIIGYDEGELTGKHISEFTPYEEGVYESTTGKMVEIKEEFISHAMEITGNKLFMEEKITNWESYYLRKDGKIVPVENSIAYLYNEQGEPFGAIGISRDVTERKEMEDSIFQSKKLKSLGELAGGVAHNFNNILAIILGNVQLLKMNVEFPIEEESRRKSSLELKRGLEVIEKASKDGAEVVKRIYDFTRVRSEKDFAKVNISEIVDHTLEFVKARWKDEAESKGIVFNIQKRFSSLSPIEGTPSELREVFTNIINNAIDAMPQGGNIRIKTFREGTDIVIKVEDTGTGIPSALRDRIFDPFFTTKGIKFSGLGLSGSYGIISRHRGTISVDSKEGEGTTFTIKLPVSDGVVETEQRKPIEVDHRKAKILVIEDEEQVRNILSAMLVKGGHEVKTATSGSQGIELFERNEFDLVFTDLGMPGMSGWQVAEKINRINEEVPVALITGWNIELEEYELKKSGVDLIVKKPFDVNQVLRLVQEGMILRDKFKKD